MPTPFRDQKDTDRDGCRPNSQAVHIELEMNINIHQMVEGFFLPFDSQRSENSQPGRLHVPEWSAARMSRLQDGETGLRVARDKASSPAHTS